MAHTAGADKANVLHVTIAESDLTRLGFEAILLGLPYATHLLDNRTSHRVDKRSLLRGKAVTVRSVFAALVADDDMHDLDAFPQPWGQRPMQDGSPADALGWGLQVSRPEGMVSLSMVGLGGGGGLGGGEALPMISRDMLGSAPAAMQEWRGGRHG